MLVGDQPTSGSKRPHNRGNSVSLGTATPFFPCKGEKHIAHPLREQDRGGNHASVQPPEGSPGNRVAERYDSVRSGAEMARI